MKILVKKILLLLGVTLLAVNCSRPEMPENKHKSSINKRSEDILKEDPSGKYYILGGDIILDKEDPNHQEIINALLNPTRAIKKVSSKPWPNGNIPYCLDGNFTSTDLSNINAAMRTWESVANVRFSLSNCNIQVYRIIKSSPDGSGGSSTFGYSIFPYYNFIENYYSTILHELGHGLGFSHEHQRYDRDNYVSRDGNNCGVGAHNFEIIPLNILNFTVSNVYGTYDYDSIMHYRCGFITKDPDYQSRIGNLELLSGQDQYAAREVYGPPAQPDIEVTINGQFITTGGLYKAELDITPEELGGTHLTVIIKNVGGGVLNLVGDIQKLFGSTNLVIAEQPDKFILNSGETSSFIIKLTTQIPGVYSATFRINNDDPDPNPYNYCKESSFTFTIKGTGVVKPIIFMPYQDRSGSGWSSFRTLIADVNGDGKDDIIWNSTGSTNRTYVGISNGDGTFDMKPYQDRSESSWSSYKTLIADINGDGKDDIIWNSTDSTNRTYVGIANQYLD